MIKEEREREREREMSVRPLGSSHDPGGRRARTNLPGRGQELKSVLLSRVKKLRHSQGNR